MKRVPIALAGAVAVAFAQFAMPQSSGGDSGKQQQYPSYGSQQGNRRDRDDHGDDHGGHGRD